jgi:hypothetical protein
MQRSVGRVIGAIMMAAVLTACTQSMAGSPAPAAATSSGSMADGSMGGGHGMATAVTSSNGHAAGLRAALNTLLQEHVYLAAAATGAALDGREAEFKAAAGALDENSVAIARAVGSVYGADAEKAFLPLWRRHIGFAVDYTVGVAAKDRARQDRAVQDLIGYTNDFGAFLASANPNLPKSVVADLVKHHVVTLKSVIDAQATRDAGRAYTALRAAAGHMQQIADPLAEAIVKQFPDRFRG